MKTRKTDRIRKKSGNRIYEIRYNGSDVTIRIMAIFMIKLITQDRWNRMMIRITIMFVGHLRIFFFCRNAFRRPVGAEIID